MPLWLINILVTLTMEFGTMEEQGNAIGYRWGKFTFIDNMDPCYVHFLWKDTVIYEQ
jgi:hypothetical protein